MIRDRRRARGTTGGDRPGDPGGGTSWVGIVANRGSGAGRGRRLVEELVQELRRLHLPAEVAWTPEARSALVLRAARGPTADAWSPSAATARSRPWSMSGPVRR